MTAALHAAAIKALLAPTVRLHEGERPDSSPLPAAVLFVPSGTRTRTTLATISDRRDVPFQVTSVGLDPEGVRSVAQRVQDALLDRRPAIAGRTCWPITQEGSDPIRLDRDVNPHVYYAVDLYNLSSVPAPA